MDDEGKFWLGTTAIVAITLITIVCSALRYNDNRDAYIADMVASGADPQKVVCAMHDDYGKNPTCIILATKGGK